MNTSEILTLAATLRRAADKSSELTDDIKRLTWILEEPTACRIVLERRTDRDIRNHTMPFDQCLGAALFESLRASLQKDLDKYTEASATIRKVVEEKI